MNSTAHANPEVWEAHVNSVVWDQVILGQAKLLTPVLISLKDPSHFPNQKQYPLKPEAKLGL